MAECLSRFTPRVVKNVAVRDTFGASGEAEELNVKFGITTADIVNAALVT